MMGSDESTEEGDVTGAGRREGGRLWEWWISQSTKSRSYIPGCLSQLIASLHRWCYFHQTTYRYGQVCIFAPTSMFLFLKWRYTLNLLNFQ